MASTGPLVPADEMLLHQITDTFASVGQTDPSWTEKVWCTAAAIDGSLQVTFGVGKYVNRGIFDGFAGVARGVEQWTLRASRELAPHPDLLAVGPLEYEIVEPLRSVRFSLGANEHVPVSFDVVFDGDVPPAIDLPLWPTRSADGYRLADNVVRYHQCGVARGWIEVQGQRHEIEPDGWAAFRDRSWGVRDGIGAPLTDAKPPGSVPSRMLVMWSPMRLEYPDGTPYVIFASYMQHPGGTFFKGAEESVSGRRKPFLSVRPELRFRDDNRRLLGGELYVTDEDEVERVLTITPVSAEGTSFHLGPALYFGYGGQHHGAWRGELSVEGEHVTNCADPEVARRIHQLRDTLVRVEDPGVGGTGYGLIETLAVGEHPALGLTESASFL